LRGTDEFYTAAARDPQVILNEEYFLAAVRDCLLFGRPEHEWYASALKKQREAGVPY
jgi:hypothetical protein